MGKCLFDTEDLKAYNLYELATALRSRGYEPQFLDLDNPASVRLLVCEGGVDTQGRDRNDPEYDGNRTLGEYEIGREGTRKITCTSVDRTTQRGKELSDFLATFKL